MDASSSFPGLQGCLGMLDGSRHGRGFQGQNRNIMQPRGRNNGNGNGNGNNGNGVNNDDVGFVSPNEVDRIIAKEMTDLTLQEREKAEDDVHGIGRNNEEDALVLESNLLQMQKLLDELKFGTAYEEAERIDISYARDRDLRLMFLRADRYKPKEATERMIRWFDLKKSLFGSTKLCQTITLEDLDQDDMECLRSGYMQIPPYQDMAGRVVMIALMKLRQMKSKESMSRVAFYTFMSAMETPTAQQRGMVGVYYLLDATNHVSSVTGKLRTTMPVFFASLHLCYNDIQQYALTCMGVYALNQQTKVRFRPHYGSHIEVQYALTTFGIPKQALPVSDSGEMSRAQHLLWIESRRQIEGQRRMASQKHDQHFNQQPSAHDVLSESLEPFISWSPHPASDESVNSTYSQLKIEPNDVLFGRGKTVVEHVGNLRFRKIVAGYADEFDRGSRLEKTCLTEKIVREIGGANGRFLKRDSGGAWEEVDHDAARKKVAHAFRNRRKQANHQQHHVSALGHDFPLGRFEGI